MFALLLAVALLPDANAFDSYPVGSAHDRITGRAACEVGLRVRWRRRVKQHVRRQDLDQLALDLGMVSRLGLARAMRLERGMVPTHRYRPAHHFDRAEDEPVAEAFWRGVESMQQARVAALALLRDGDDDAAMAQLGIALHGLQDLVSHSNVIELPPHAIAQVEASVFEGAPLPEGHPLDLAWYNSTPTLPSDAAAPPSLADQHQRCEDGETSHFCVSLDHRGTWRGRQRLDGERRFRLGLRLARAWTVRWLDALIAEFEPDVRERLLRPRFTKRAAK